MQTFTKMLVLGLLTATLGLTACSSMSQQDKRMAGTGVGAVAGGVIGDAVFGSPVGMIGGAAAGALAGNAIGNHYN